MKNKPKPYLGVTGFTRQSQVKLALDTFALNMTKGKRCLMVGVLVSYKTLAGSTNRYAKRYPKVQRLKGIFLKHLLSFNVIHYNTRNVDTLAEQLSRLVNLAGPHLRGFQLNVCWPDPEQLAAFKKSWPCLRLILQVGGHALRDINNRPDKLVEKLRAYEGLADYLLLDASGGRGYPFDVKSAMAHLRAIKHAELPFRLGVAGGLAPENIKKLVPIREEFPKISVDAEGRLRTKNNGLDPYRLTHYIQVALQVLEGSPTATKSKSSTPP